jgi:hypothetical protein
LSETLSCRRVDQRSKLDRLIPAGWSHEAALAMPARSGSNGLDGLSLRAVLRW